MLLTRATLLLAILVGGLGSYESPQVASSRVFSSTSPVQADVLSSKENSWLPNEVRILLSRDSIPDRSRNNILGFAIGQEPEYKFSITIQSDAVEVKIGEASSGLPISDFRAMIDRGISQDGTYWVSVVLGSPSIVRIGWSRVGTAESVLAEKTLPEPIELGEAGVPVIIEMLDIPESFRVRVDAISYRKVGDLGMPPSVSHATRVFLLLVVGFLAAKKLFSHRRRLTGQEAIPER